MTAELPSRALARTWAHRLHEVSFVPHRLSRTTIPLLEDFALRLTEQLDAAECDPAVAHRIGADMVAAKLWAPAALRVTVELFVERFRAGPPDRLGVLLGAFTEGFTEAVRAIALTETDDTRRFERARHQREVLRAEREKQHALLHDQLTGLPNRHALLTYLADVLDSPQRPDRIGLCVVDLARFADLNDAFGVEQGDALLREVGLRMRDLTTAHGVYAAHLGGDEFVVVQRTRGVDDVVKLFGLVREALAYPWGSESHPIRLDAKAGLERATADASPGELLRTAKMALTWAKSDPVAAHALFEPQRHDADQRRHRLSRDLPQALQRGELRLAYQPIVSLDDRRMSAVEALARWDHPVHGAVSPAEFIPLAERIRLLNALVDRQLREACAHALSWQRPGRPVRLNLNLSTAQLNEPTLPAIIEAALDETGFPAALLTFEVTEQAITDPRAGYSTLAAIAGLGVSFAIDDFGVGYSNFARLREAAELSVTTMKIDRSLLTSGERCDERSGERAGGTAGTMAADAAGDVMLRTIIDLAHGLGLRAVAEGVETEAQAAHLCELGCDYAQGHLFAQATHPAHVAPLLRS